MKNCWVNFRLSQDEKKKLQLLAERLGRKPSDTLRWLINSAAGDLETVEPEKTEVENVSTK